MIPRFCPICGDTLVLVQHTPPSGDVYYQWECPEQDWFEPAGQPEQGQDYETVVDEV